MKQAIITAALLLLSVSAAAQYNPDEYFFNNESLAEESAPRVDSDEDLFYVPLTGQVGIYQGISEFNFSAVKFSRRGYGDSYRRLYFDLADLSTGLTSSVDYSLASLLRRSRLAVEKVGGISISPSAGASTAVGGVGISGTGGYDLYFGDVAAVTPMHRVAVSASDRRGRWGANIFSANSLGKGWSYLAMASGRWGKDAQVDGVFLDELSFSAALQKEFSANHKLRIAAMGNSSLAGRRSYATQEAFELTGDNLYNPSWGYYDGKMRSSKVARRFQPLLTAGYEGRITKNTTLEATLAYRFGESAYSALAWWDAPTPYADYYRDMPGWWGHSEAMRRRLTQLWRDRDPSVVQLDWRAIVAGNDKDRPDEAIVLEDRVERVSEMQAAFAARTALGARSYVLYGVRYRNENTSYFKRMKDRLGSASAEDIDQYLVDDGTAHNSMAHNDIRQRGRLIDEGDKFGYNYEMRASTTSAFVMASHSGRRYEVAAQVELASSSIQRHGRYEKEIYPGKLSYGPSRKFEFAVGSVKLAGRYSFSPRHIVTLAGDIGTSAPRYGSIFLSPDYSNRAIRAPKVEKLISGEAGYTFVAGSLRLELAGYITRASDQTAIYRYYDDIQSAYSEMVLSGVDKSYMGLEFGGRWDITAKFSLNVAAAIGRYVYASYPKVELFEDRTLELYSNLNVKSAPDTTFLKNYHLGGSPEMALSAEFSYNNRGWLISLTGNVMGGRYVEPNPLRRMARVYEETKTRHNLNLMVDQEKLDPAFTFDLFVMKSFMMTDRVRLTLMLTVDNLLNDRNIKYNGYEPMRIHETEESNRVYYTTHASRYLYSYGRSWYASAIFRF